MTQERDPLRCRFGIHSWQHHRNDEGQGYLTGYRCDKYVFQMSFVDSTTACSPADSPNAPSRRLGRHQTRRVAAPGTPYTPTPLVLDRVAP